MDDPFGFGREQEIEATSHQRVANRDSMFLHARIERPGSSDLQLRVRNLSSGGMMAETTEPFAPGEPIGVELRGIGLVPSHVAWVRGGRVGIAFDRPVDPKLTRKMPPRSPGAALTLIPPVTDARRPAVKTG